MLAASILKYINLQDIIFQTFCSASSLSTNLHYQVIICLLIYLYIYYWTYTAIPWQFLENV